MKILWVEYLDYSESKFRFEPIEGDMRYFTQWNKMLFQKITMNT
jgi:hypothetical protein